MDSITSDIRPATILSLKEMTTFEDRIDLLRVPDRNRYEDVGRGSNYVALLEIRHYATIRCLDEAIIFPW